MYGWQISHYSGKLRGYLNYKGLNFEEHPINAYELTRLIPRKVGSLVMPVLLTREGEWLSDTTEIIEELERRHPTPSVFPQSPRQLIASLVLATWADEFWTPSTMHYRWSFPENYPRFRNEAGRNLLPFMPTAIRNWIADNIPAKKMRSYLPNIGVNKPQLPIIESWTTYQLDLLESHFSRHTYLFGEQPTVADHALIGPLYAHLYGDPVPGNKLINPRPNLKSWIERTHNGECSEGELLTSDEIPETLSPVFEDIFEEFYSMVSEIAYVVEAYIQHHNLQSGSELPRSLSDVSFPMKGKQFSRTALPFTLWKAQRIQQTFFQFSKDAQESVIQWLSGAGHGDLMSTYLGPKLERSALATKLK
jgi:glutathione S-transferase